MKHLFSLSILLLISNITFGQIDTVRIQQLENVLDAYAKDNPKVKEKADIAFEGNLKDFVTALAVNHQLNLTVDSKIKAQINNNFSDVLIRDVLIFICRTYDLTLVFTGSIISIEPYEKTPKALPPPNKMQIDYNTFNQLITIKLKNDTLSKALNKISELTGFNTIAAKDIRNDLVSFEITKSKVEDAIYALATAQQYDIDEENGYFTLSNKVVPTAAAGNGNTGNNNNRNNNTNRNTRTNTVSNTLQGTVKVRVRNDSIQQISINAVNVPIVQVLNEVSSKTGIDYYLFAEPEGSTTIQLENITYDEFL